MSALPRPHDSSPDVALCARPDWRFASGLQAQVGQLKAANEALEMRLELRTRELAEANERNRRHQGLLSAVIDNLDEAQVLCQLHELEASNRDLKTFAYSISHDLRGPLQAIEGFSAMLDKRLGNGQDETTRHYITRIRSGVTRMGKLVDGLLGLANVGRQHLAARPVDMAILAHSVLDELVQAGLLPAAAASVAPDMPVASGDAVLLRQVLVNLLANAAKFTAHRPSPEIRVGWDHREGGTVYWVRDNGAGFDMAHAQRLFEPFQRFHNQRDFSGTGIGLSIVQRIVLRHGGNIWAEAAPDQGACFYFTLHAGEGSALQPAPKGPA